MTTIAPTDLLEGVLRYSHIGRGLDIIITIIITVMIVIMLAMTMTMMTWREHYDKKYLRL